MNTELREEIIRELGKVRAPAKVARNLGVDIRVVLPIADELSGRPRILHEEQHDGMGRPELRAFFVARKKAWEAWDNTLAEVAEARARYEAGTHTLATGRDGQWLILYSIPLLHLDPRPHYFSLGD